jgi:hypothetical protein
MGQRERLSCAAGPLELAHSCRLDPSQDEEAWLLHPVLVSHWLTCREVMVPKEG